MKKLISFCLALAMAASLAACSQGGSGSSSQAAGESISSAVEESSIAGEESSAAEASETPAETPETVTITSLNAEGAETQLEVPYDPQRIAILDALGVGDRVVGTASTSLDYLQSYINEDIANLGTIKEADLEAVMSCEPDVIFIGGRLASSYDALSEIAPVVYLSTDTEQGVVESVRKNANTIASLFGLEEEVDSLMADFDSRITALAEFAEGKTAIVGLVTSAPPTATRPPLSLWWRRTRTTSLCWTGMPPSRPKGPSWPRRLWRMSWSKAPGLIRTATLCTFPALPCGTPPKGASPLWT